MQVNRLALWVLWLAGTGTQGQIWLRFDYEKVSLEKQTLPPGKFTEAELRRRALDFLDQVETIPYARAIYGIGSEILDYIDKGLEPAEPRAYFFRLRHEFPKGLHTWPRLAMVLKMGRTGILRIREKGRVKEILLTPDYPPPGHELGYEVLDVAGDICGPRKCCGLFVYLRKAKGEIRREDLKAIGQRFCEIDPALKYYVYSRPDSWFIEDPSFPFLYAFDEGYRLPDPKTWQKSRDEWSIWKDCNSSKDAQKSP
jgi:hypothetical protein